MQNEIPTTDFPSSLVSLSEFSLSAPFKSSALVYREIYGEDVSEASKVAIGVSRFTERAALKSERAQRTSPAHATHSSRFVPNALRFSRREAACTKLPLWKAVLQNVTRKLLNEAFVNGMHFFERVNRPNDTNILHNISFCIILHQDIIMLNKKTYEGILL